MAARNDLYSYSEFLKVIRENNVTSDVYAKFVRNFSGEKRLPMSPSKAYAFEWVGWSHVYTDKPIAKPRPSFYQFCEIIHGKVRRFAEYDLFRQSYDGPFSLPSKPHQHYDEWTCYEDIRPNMHRRFATFEEFCSVLSESPPFH